MTTISIQTAAVGTAISGTTTHNLQVDPLLRALANNGGPTFTNADQASSPGTGDIPFAASMCNGFTGTNVDQRGFARGAGGRCDVGAYESRQASQAPASVIRRLSGTPVIASIPSNNGIMHRLRRQHANNTKSSGGE